MLRTRHRAGLGHTGELCGLTGGNDQFATYVEHIAIDLVGTSQAAQTDTVAVGDATEGVTARDDILKTAPVGCNPGAGRWTGVKIIAYTAGNCPCRALLKLFFGQAFFLTGVADETRLNQY